MNDLSEVGKADQHHSNILNSSLNDYREGIAKTSPFPIDFEADYARGCWIYHKSGEKYLDLTSGIGVSNFGHGHPEITAAIHQQVDRHLHVMVFGEFIQDAQLKLAKNLQKLFPSNLNQLYPVNSGTEAVEAALKLAKRATGRTEIISLHRAYHGSTHGSLSVSGNEQKKRAFRPLLPSVKFIDHDAVDQLNQITSNTACVIVELVQGDAGVRIASKRWAKALSERCKDVGALLIVDEIQAGMGRTGAYFSFQHYDVHPSIVVLGKAMGGGMPIGGVVANHALLELFTTKPMLGHITTFGGHPVSCAAGAEACNILANEIDLEQVEQKGLYMAERLKHPRIKNVRQIGLMLAIDLESADQVDALFNYCLSKGVFIFWFLSTDYAFRIAPPLTISYDEIDFGLQVILDGLNHNQVASD